MLCVDRTGGVGGNKMRDRSTIKRLQMYRNFKAKRFVNSAVTSSWY